jgi:hypothetical protein
MSNKKYILKTLNIEENKWFGLKKNIINLENIINDLLATNKEMIENCLYYSKAIDKYEDINFNMSEYYKKYIINEYNRLYKNNQDSYDKYYNPYSSIIKYKEPIDNLIYDLNSSYSLRKDTLIKKGKIITKHFNDIIKQIEDISEIKIDKNISTNFINEYINNIKLEFIKKKNFDRPYDRTNNEQLIQILLDKNQNKYCIFLENMIDFLTHFKELISKYCEYNLRDLKNTISPVCRSIDLSKKEYDKVLDNIIKNITNKYYKSFFEEGKYIDKKSDTKEEKEEKEEPFDINKLKEYIINSFDRKEGTNIIRFSDIINDIIINSKKLLIKYFILAGYKNKDSIITNQDQINKEIDFEIKKIIPIKNYNIKLNINNIDIEIADEKNDIKQKLIENVKTLKTHLEEIINNIIKYKEYADVYINKKIIENITSEFDKDLINFKSIKNISDKRRKYIQLSLKYHPDKIKGRIIEYKILNNTFDETKLKIMFNEFIQIINNNKPQTGGTLFNTYKNILEFIDKFIENIEKNNSPEKKIIILSSYIYIYLRKINSILKDDLGELIKLYCDTNNNIIKYYPEVIKLNICINNNELEENKKIISQFILELFTATPTAASTVVTPPPTVAASQSAATDATAAQQQPAQQQPAQQQPAASTASTPASTIATPPAASAASTSAASTSAASTIATPPAASTAAASIIATPPAASTAAIPQPTPDSNNDNKKIELALNEILDYLFNENNTTSDANIISDINTLFNMINSLIPDKDTTILKKQIETKLSNQYISSFSLDSDNFYLDIRRMITIFMKKHFLPVLSGVCTYDIICKEIIVSYNKKIDNIIIEFNTILETFKKTQPTIYKLNDIATTIKLFAYLLIEKYDDTKSENIKYIYDEFIKIKDEFIKIKKVNSSNLEIIKVINNIIPLIKPKLEQKRNRDETTDTESVAAASVSVSLEEAEKEEAEKEETEKEEAERKAKEEADRIAKVEAAKKEDEINKLEQEIIILEANIKSKSAVSDREKIKTTINDLKEKKNKMTKEYISSIIPDKLFEIFGIKDNENPEIKTIKEEISQEIKEAVNNRKTLNNYKIVIDLLDKFKNKKIDEIDTNIIKIVNQIVEHLNIYPNNQDTTDAISSMKELIKRLLLFQTIVLLNKIMEDPGLDHNLLNLFGELVNNLNKKLDIYNGVLGLPERKLHVEGGGKLLITKKFQYKYYHLMKIKKILKNIQKK